MTPARREFLLSQTALGLALLGYTSRRRGTVCFSSAYSGNPGASGKELDRDLNPPLEPAPNKDATLTPARREFLLSQSTLGQSVLAAEKYNREIVRGVNKASQNNAENLVRVARDGGRNRATERAGRQQQTSRDTTAAIGQDAATRRARNRGNYAAAIVGGGTAGNSASQAQRRGRYVRGGGNR